MNDTTIVEKILRSLSPKYEYVVCSTKESKDTDALTLDEIQSLSNDKEKGEKSNFLEKEEVETLLMAVHNKQEESQNIYLWYVDTGCSNHMCGNKSSFSYLNEDFHTTVSFRDKSIVHVVGKGDISIRTKNGFVETISNDFFVPALKSNLLNVGQLQEKGYVIMISKGVCEIYDPSRGAIAVVPMNTNRLFPLVIDCVQ
ncbi:hypothetical protein ES319_A10G170000v1, partial [Gossypium barbadense]